MSKLDFSKSYGTVTGGETQARFEQGGKHFDAHGDELVEPKAAAPLEVKKGGKKAEAQVKEAEEPAAPDAGSAQLAAQLQG